MTYEELSSIFKDKVNNMMNPEEYKKILYMNNKLTQYDYINRILIHVQLENPYDVRTADYWEQCGRKIIDISKCAYVIIPHYVTTYTNEEGETIRNIDLTNKEMELAIKYGLITKDSSIDKIDILRVYDVTNTTAARELTECEYNNKSVEINIDKLIDIFCKVTGCTVKIGDINYIDNNFSTLEVKKTSYEELAEFLSNKLCKYYLTDIIKSEILAKFNDAEKKLLRDSVETSLKSLLSVECNKSFDSIYYARIDSIHTILGIVDTIISDIMSLLEKDNAEDFYDSEIKLRKAKKILKLVEANYEYTKLYGNHI